MRADIPTCLRSGHHFAGPGALGSARSGHHLPPAEHHRHGGCVAGGFSDLLVGPGPSQRSMVHHTAEMDDFFSGDHDLWAHGRHWAAFPIFFQYTNARATEEDLSFKPLKNGPNHRKFILVHYFTAYTACFKG